LPRRRHDTSTGPDHRGDPGAEGLNTAVEYAVESGQLEENALSRVRPKRVAMITEVDPRVVVTVASWDRARGRRLVAFSATMYYAGQRPAEATAQREADCQFPAQAGER